MTSPLSPCTTVRTNSPSSMRTNAVAQPNNDHLAQRPVISRSRLNFDEVADTQSKPVSSLNNHIRPADAPNVVRAAAIVFPQNSEVRGSPRKRGADEFLSRATPRPNKRVPIEVRSPCIHSGSLHINGVAYPIEFLGKGNEHKVYKFSGAGEASIPTFTGLVKINLEKVVFKILGDEKQQGRSAREQMKKDQIAFDCLPSKFAHFGRIPEVAQRLVAADVWNDPAYPKNGVDIWTRYLPVDRKNEAVMEAFWNFAKDICHLAIRYGIEFDAEFVGDFRPDNIMRDPDSMRFVIIDACAPEDDEWASRLRAYVREWCEVCNKPVSEMVSGWTEAERAAFYQIEVSEVV